MHQAWQVKQFASRIGRPSGVNCGLSCHLREQMLLFYTIAR